MATLAELIQQPGKRAAVLAASNRVLEAEVAGKKGFTGVGVRAAFGVVKRFKPGFVPQAIDHLLDEFLSKLEPYWAAHNAAGGGSFGTYLVARKGEVADALLGVTDARAAKSTARTLKKAYNQLRPKGKQHVEEAMPNVGRMIDEQLG